MTEATQTIRKAGRTLANLFIPGATTFFELIDSPRDPQAIQREYAGSEDFIEDATLAGSIIIDGVKLAAYVGAYCLYNSF